MEKDLKKFMENVNILNKDFCEYEQKDKGFYFVLGTAQLICGCEYAELDELQLKTALFNQEIEKGNYEKTTVKRPVPKDTITKNPKDATTLIEKDVEVSKVWIVRNQLKLSKSFNNKEEAVKFAKSINEKVMNAIK
jgi:hypothetical protein